MRCKSQARKLTQNDEEDAAVGAPLDLNSDASDECSDDEAGPPSMATRTLSLPHSPHPALCLLEDSLLPTQLELKESHVHGLGVWARVVVPVGHKFGPYLGRLRSIPISTNYAWQVTDPTGQAAGWIDASEPSVGNWMKYVRLAATANQHNLRATLNKGQVYYQVTQDIEIGEELLLADKNILYSEESEGSAETESFKQEGGDFLGRAAGALGFSSVDFDFSQHSELSDTFAFSQDSSSPEPGTRGSSSLFGAGSFSSDADANGNAFKCVACDQSFSDVIRLDEHMLIDHYGQESSSGEYKCDQCPKVFSWKSNLIRHQAAHEEGRRYVCENCHKVFTDPSNLQRHIRSQHIGARSHACPECGKTFATSSGLKQHTHIHSSVKPFQCEVCLKSYTQFSNLCRHKRMHADCRMQIKCHKCGQAFSTVTSLSKHKRFCEGAASPGALAAAAANASASTASLINFGEKTPSMSLAQSTTASSNHLMFYPRPGFPFYPPSLVAYPMFSGAAALPPHPSLLASNPLMMQAGVKVKPDSPDSSEQAAAAMVNGALSRTEASIKKEKRGSEGSESEVSDDVSSAGISDDVDVSTGSDFDSESDDPRYKAEKSMQHSKAKTPHPEYGMSPTAREGSPKQAATYPGGAVKDHITNGMLKALTVACPPPDMPFDLSVNNKIQHMSPAAKPPTAPDATKEDEPLDLRLDHKKSPKVEDNAHKTHVFGEKKEETSTPPLPPQPPQHPPQLHLQQQQPQQHRHTPRTPTTPVSMSEATLSPTKFQMAYPRPIHPLMVDPQLYKPKYPPFPTDGRVMVPFPHPRYPLMAPLMNGLNGSASAFDMLRSQMEKMGKPYQDVLAPHVNKLKERYSCKFCGKIFPRSANLTRHLRTHTGEQPYKCKYCERSFSISSNLQRHVRNIHNKEKPFKCPLCDRCFGQQTNLDRHLKKHESDGPTILDDSPKSSDLNDKDDAYFDEIRNFIGKVTEPSGGADPSTAPSTPNRLVGDPLLMDKSLSNGKRSPNLSAKDMDEELEEDEEEDEDTDCHPTPPKRMRKESPPMSEEGAPSPQAPSLSPGPGSPPSQRPTKGSLAYEVMMQFNKKTEAEADKASDSDDGKARTSPYCKDLSKSMIGREKAVEV